MHGHAHEPLRSVIMIFCRNSRSRKPEADGKQNDALTQRPRLSNISTTTAALIPA
jgi:hypothetical protein